MMLMESGVLLGTVEALRAIPPSAQSSPTQSYLGMRASWVGTTSTLLLNLVYWVLWLGTSYLLFFWKDPRGSAPARD